MYPCLALARPPECHSLVSPSPPQLPLRRVCQAAGLAGTAAPSIPQPQSSTQLLQYEDGLGEQMIPISLLSALSRSLAELSGTMGLCGAAPAHPSAGRKLKGGQPARQTPSCPSHGELKAALTLSWAAHCLFLSSGSECFIHQSPASHFALQDCRL